MLQLHIQFRLALLGLKICELHMGSGSPDYVGFEEVIGEDRVVEVRKNRPLRLLRRGRNHHQVRGVPQSHGVSAPPSVLPEEARRTVGKLEPRQKRLPGPPPHDRHYLGKPLPALLLQGRDPIQHVPLYPALVFVLRLKPGLSPLFQPPFFPVGEVCLQVPELQKEALRGKEFRPQKVGVFKEVYGVLPRVLLPPKLRYQASEEDVFYVVHGFNHESGQSMPSPKSVFHMLTCIILRSP